MTITVRTLDGVVVASVDGPDDGFDELPLEKLPDGVYWLVREDKTPPVKTLMDKRGDDYYMGGCTPHDWKVMSERPKPTN